MAVKWTKEQSLVINQRHTNILASAAAGSGKTAVLVEHIIGMVTDPVHPVDIDHLLVVTFTRAAAGEMKDRIGRALEQRLREDPENEHLQRQGVLLHHAQINTIHGFCTYVIQNYFHRINLDPGYRIAEDGELKMLKARVLQDLLEEEYLQTEQEAGNDMFQRFMDAYAPGKTDAKAEDLILKIYDFAISDPDPVLWLQNAANAYCIRTKEELCHTGWMQNNVREAGLILADVVSEAEQNLEKAQQPGGPAGYVPALESDLELTEELAACKTYGEYYETLHAMKYAKLSSKKTQGEDPELREALKNDRKRFKDMVDSLKADYFSKSEEVILEELDQIRPYIEELVHLVTLFMERFSESKRKRNIADFSDLEHFALKILLEKKEDGTWQRTDAAKELADHFAEIITDEYQDSNYIQEAILEAVSGTEEKRYDRFMVGDMKQSIYGFRMARPDLFLQKYEEYPVLRPDDEDNTARQLKGDASRKRSSSVRIDLDRNFRSRRQVLDCANAFFRRLMIPELGGIRYDEAQSLHYGADFPESKDPDFPRAELLLVNREAPEFEDDRSKETMVQAEALAVAGKIRELIARGKVWDRDAGKFRPLAYRDCVILMRSPGQWADVFARTLQDEGIPAYTTSKSGYFSALEVTVVLNYLNILDNPGQDIPLTAVLRSPIVGCSDEELVKLRISDPEGSIYDLVRQYAETGEDAELSEKLQRFLEQLSSFRERIPYTEVHDLILQVIEETGYGRYASAMPGGAQREANLKMLGEKAVDYENTSYHGLFNFIRYIERMKKYEVDYGEVNLFSEAEDTVRIMSIHKSKGLEFPVVFVSCLGNQFNLQDVQSRVVLHARFGIGMEAVDLSRNTRQTSAIQTAIRKAVKRDTLGEEIRILYVAMTRAREKLILTGVVSDGDRISAIQEAQEQTEIFADPGETPEEAVRRRKNLQEKPLSYHKLITAKSLLDWVLMAVPAKEILSVKAADAGQMGDSVVLSEMQTDEMVQEIEEAARSGRIFDPEIYDFLDRQAAFRYPYQRAAELPAKMTVTEIKMRSLEAMEEEKGAELYAEEPVVPLVPEFMREEQPQTETGAARGTIYHHVLECLDYSPVDRIFQERETDGEPAEKRELAEGLAEEVRRQVKDMEVRGLLSETDAACILPEDFVKFLLSKIGGRMREASMAGRLHREQPFVIDIPAKDIDSRWTEDENILVQGTIDAYFSENGRYVIVDYKTDRVHTKDGRDLVEKYQKQLEYYSKALSEITGIEVAETYIYSVALGRDIAVTNF